MLKFFLSCCLLLLASLRAGWQSQHNRFFEVDPTKYNRGFTYLLFPFNPAFIKEHRIKSICYRFQNDSGRHCREFNQQGQQIYAWRFFTNDETGQPDPPKREERIYNRITGLLDTLIDFDLYNRPLFTKVNCYSYDQVGRLQEIRSFGFTEQENHPPASLPEQPVIGIPFSKDDTLPGKPVFVNRTSVNGRPVDPAAIAKLAGNNDFSSFRYSYRKEGDKSVVRQTEIYNFMKGYRDADTCQTITAFISSGGQVVYKNVSYDCGPEFDPSEYYAYRNGYLDSIISIADQPRNVAMIYDAHHNFVGIHNLWSGVHVSTLQMTYDRKGLVLSLKRKSVPGKSNYFMDSEIFFSYEFY